MSNFQANTVKIEKREKPYMYTRRKNKDHSTTIYK